MYLFHSPEKYFYHIHWRIKEYQNMWYCFKLALIRIYFQMIPYGTGISAALEIGKDLGVNEVQAVWIAGSYPYVFSLKNILLMGILSIYFAYTLSRLTQGAFVLIGGRIGAVFGHKNTLLAAGIW